jgi:hypothetical protein
MDSAPLRFSLPNVYQGLGLGAGIATATAEGLRLEFEVKDGFVGMLKSGVQNVDIRMNELYSVNLKQGWFTTKLFVRTRSMSTLQSIPGADGAQVELRIARKDRRAAQNLVSMLTLSLSELQLRALTASPDDRRSTPTALR